MNKVTLWQLKNEFQGVLLIGFSLVIFKLYVNGNLYYILAPKMTPFTIFTMIFLFIMGLFRLFNSDMEGADCGCEACDTSNPLLSPFRYAFFLIPIVLAYSIEDLSMEPEQFNQKGIVIYPPHFYEEVTAQEEKLAITDENYFMMRNALFAKPEDFIGKTITISGFLYRGNDLFGYEAAIARQVMSCCIADTASYGFLLSGNTNMLVTGKWYEITGIIKQGEYDNKKVPIIKVAKIYEINPPQETFLYD
ncbi:TIGR03943 family protein [Bacillaceae bacterium Marseille-Q3522]|nr:TIGR03943 family protein [Bacillaceae bacterium Marseille-Q3522]